MPEVNGMKFPYTEQGKKDAKMAAVNMIATKKMRKNGPKKAKSDFSGVKSQVYGG